MNKIYIMITIMALLTCSLFATDYYYEVGDFSEHQTIYTAVRHSQGLVLDNNDNVFITIYPNAIGTYTENIVFTANANYHFIGSVAECIKIQPEDNSLPIFNALWSGNTSQSGELYLENIAFINVGYQEEQQISDNNSAVKYENRKLDVKNCIFNPDLESIFGSDIVVSDDGGFNDGCYKELNIENSAFKNGTYSTDSHLGYTIYNNVNVPYLDITVSGNEFHENGLNNRLMKISNVSGFTFENNSIYGTNMTDSYPAIELTGFHYSVFYIIDNYFKDIDYIGNLTQHFGSRFEIEDNVILNCTQMNITGGHLFQNNIITTKYDPNDASNTLNINSSEISANTFIELNDTQRVSLVLNSDNIITNNIFSNYANNVVIRNHDTVLANCFDLDFTLENQITNFSQNLNIKGENYFVDINNENFSLELPSSAIGNGYSAEFDDPASPGYDIKLITYQDDTIDMGAIPFDQDRKEYKTFIAGENTKNWTGFPAIDNVSTTNLDINGSNHTLPSNNMHVVFKDLFLQHDGVEVEYQDMYLNELAPLVFRYSNPVDEGRVVSAYKGYKITTDTDVSSWFSGLLQNPNASVLLPNTSGEIWLGYPATSTTPVLYAFSEIEEILQSIKHKDYYLFRIGGRWHGIPHERSTTNLELGDFVSITFRPGVTPPRSFRWRYLVTSDPNSFRYQDAEFVTFEEESDYTPFFVDIDEGTSIEEIALYADNECIGGAKTQGETTVMIKSFMEDIPADSEISIVAFTGAKSSKKVDQILEYNSALQIWNSAKRVNKDNRDFYHISIREDHDSLLETNSIVTSNYPNPFNPETTIEFNNPVQGEVNINIYNLKGQLVKSLLQDNLTQGVHKVVWQGTDSHNRQVASGVYFYRINSANKKSITKKIILMK